MANITVSAAAQHLVINEVDYDQDMTDTAEFLEIYNPSTSAVDLTNIAIVLINGSNNNPYPSTTPLSLASVGSIPAGGYLVIAGANVTVPAPAVKYTPTGWDMDEIQNGGSTPDGIALINTSTNTLIDALSYEGSITAANVPGLGSVSLNEGAVLDMAIVDTDDNSKSLCRTPNGTDTDNANADWQVCTTLTPGTANP
jgi:hypothetical protein